ncbi:hypothetical protein HanHA300_Chr11g0410121 [Helianthus annuus]|nr:hypothetical protein HanHA300_Chr11g0410121 [Helianthus annuus]KAJ0510188.1 hypothetical protein HanIR_Chr11g0537901 [Helianthus annuus]KAJ0518126.1 hypothetical protein HanHA89_Chr11g0433811 [Helianthus annuus]KAJ0686151.1 hypothetical protein HanLR1_Chr11g0411401 [Helianthus annuus]
MLLRRSILLHHLCSSFSLTVPIVFWEPYRLEHVRRQKRIMIQLGLGQVAVWRVERSVFSSFKNPNFFSWNVVYDSICIFSFRNSKLVEYMKYNLKFRSEASKTNYIVQVMLDNKSQTES